MLAVGAVCALLGLAADVAVGLWTRSSVDAAAEDATRRIARAPLDASLPAAADAEFDRARRVLGPVGRSVDLVLEEVGPHRVVVGLRWTGRRLLPALVPGSPTVAGLERRIAVRREEP
ncbi:MAG: hypothetical protein ACOYOP_11755 [Microthrixaceae bacterium]